MRCYLPVLLSMVSCSTSVRPTGSDGGHGACSPQLVASKDGYCSSCSALASATCTEAKPVAACCVFTQKPAVELARAKGLVYNASDDPTVDLSCLDAPRTAGVSQRVTLSGFVKLFSTGNDSAGVKIEIFQQGADGALGSPIGTPVITRDTDPFMTPKPTLWSNCPVDGCILRQFVYADVPTETPLIIKTSDALGAQRWANLYDYDIYFSNAALAADGGTPEAHYEPTAAAVTDLATVASVAGGFTLKADRGLLAGEVHDCADVRLSGAVVATDVKPEGELFYFDDNEAKPLPNLSRAATGLGTSKLGLFGGLNYATGTPVRISAVGMSHGATTLIGTAVVRIFPGAVTALSLRGRRPWQR